MENRLEKIYVNLPNHWMTKSESMWAYPLGDDLFRIENIPFFAYGLNFRDIVRATPDSTEYIREIKELIEPSGHRTLRVIFKKQVEQVQQLNILETLKDLMVSYEHAKGRYFTLDILPKGKYNATFDKLSELEAEDILEFETCEAKIKGSFDDLIEP